MKMFRKVLVVSVSSALLMVAGNSFAKTVSTPITYDLTLTDNCTVAVTAATVSFGTSSVGGTDLAGLPAGAVAINCPAISYRWGVNAGTVGNYGAGAMANERSLKHTAALNYVSYTLSSVGAVSTANIGDVGLNAAAGGTAPTGYTETTTAGAQQAQAAKNGTAAIENFTLTANVVDVSASTLAGTYNDIVTVVVAW
jgi:hypothetical protein